MDAVSHQSGNRRAQSSEDDDDLIEIHDMPRVAAVKDEGPSTFASMTRTPPYSSRESSSSKRPINQVIDLTSDDEEQAPRGTKRQQTVYSGTTNSPHHSNISSSFAGSPLPRSSSMSFGFPKPNPARPPGPPDYRFGLS